MAGLVGSGAVRLALAVLGLWSRLLLGLGLGKWLRGFVQRKWRSIGNLLVIVGRTIDHRSMFVQTAGDALEKFTPFISLKRTGAIAREILTLFARFGEVLNFERGW